MESPIGYVYQITVEDINGDRYVDGIIRSPQLNIATSSGLDTGRSYAVNLDTGESMEFSDAVASEMRRSVNYFDKKVFRVGQELKSDWPILDIVNFKWDLTHAKLERLQNDPITNSPMAIFLLNGKFKGAEVSQDPQFRNLTVKLSAHMSVHIPSGITVGSTGFIQAKREKRDLDIMSCALQRIADKDMRDRRAVGKRFYDRYEGSDIEQIKVVYSKKVGSTRFSSARSVVSGFENHLEQFNRSLMKRPKPSPPQVAKKQPDPAPAPKADLASLDATQLCSLATVFRAGTKQWETGYFSGHVAEAKRRGLACDVGDSTRNSFASMNGSNLCSIATTRRSGTREWDSRSTYSTHVSEAKRRGLSCDVGDSTRSVSRSSTTSTAPRTSSPALQTIDEAYVVMKTSNVRQGPGTSFEKVAQLDAGDQITALGRIKDQNWYLVARDGKELGYVFGDLIEPYDLQEARRVEEEQLQQEAQARAEEERRLRVAEEARQRRLNDPDYKLFVKLKPKAEELMAQVREFLDKNPLGNISVPAALGVAKLEAALLNDSGKALDVALIELGAVVEGSEQFTSFRTALLQAGQREAERNDALVRSELAEFQTTLIRLLSSKSAPSSVLAPLIGLSDQGLTATSAADRASALKKLKSEISKNKTISKAAAGIEKEVAERRVTVRKEKNQDAVAVIIGNKTYQKGVPEVSFAHNDANAIKAYLINTLGYAERNILDLRDTPQAELLSTFGTEDNHRGRLFSMVRPGRSDVTVFYSGHGVPGLQDKRGYLLPVDADPDLVELNGYPIDQLFANLAKIDARSVLVMLDACFSGESQGGVLLEAASGITVKIRPAEGSGGMTVLTASSGDQLASWDTEAKHGLFTRHLLTGLEGTADGGRYGNGDGQVTLGELKAYLDDEMTYQARRRFNRDQRATIQGDPQQVLATLN